MRHFTALLAAALLAAHALFAAGPAEVRISYAKSPFNLPLIVGIRRGVIEQAFAKAGAKVTFFEIDSGAKQTEAMAAGSLDLAGVINTTSVILAAAGGNEVRIVSGFSQPTGLFAIVAKDPAIRTPADLKGRRVAGPKGTALHQLLAAALERSRLSMQDVSFLQMDLPAARTALLSGQVDAALLAAAQVTQAQAAGAHVVATADGYIKPQLVVAARGGFLRDHPRLVDLYVATHRELLQWIAAHREEALAIGAKEQGITPAEARALAEGSHFTADLGPAEVAALGADMDFMVRIGMLRAPVNVKDLLRPGLVRQP
jgi:NitT/TauT family transport system substrate-binding protein/sulfonate transport system substrate-binding protein